MTRWPFDEAEDTPIFTTRPVREGDEPILRVSHDDDGAWQFRGEGAPDARAAQVVALREIVEFDPSLCDLADLPEGWRADRGAPGEPWTRTRIDRKQD